MASKDGSQGDDKLRLVFEDDDDECSRTANRRVLFEEIDRTKCDPSSSSWDGPRATKGEPWNTGRSSHDWSLGCCASSWGVNEDWRQLKMALRKAAGRDKPKVKKVIGRPDGLKRTSRSRLQQTKRIVDIWKKLRRRGHLDESRRVKMLVP